MLQNRKKDFKEIHVDLEENKNKNERKRLILSIVLVLAFNIIWNILSSRWHQQNAVDGVSQVNVFFEALSSFWNSILTNLGFK